MKVRWKDDCPDAVRKRYAEDMLMHETMVAQNLLGAIVEEAKKLNAKPIGAKISCGKLYAINDEALCFAFEAIAKGTTCEGLNLKIEHKPIKGKCRNCNQSFAVDPSNPRCPKCDSEDFELLPDAPLLLEEIEFETTFCNKSQNGNLKKD